MNWALTGVYLTFLKKFNDSHITRNKGNKIAVANSPWGKFGLTICYDIRFPLLYRKLVKLGCKFLLIPAAFTVPTGKAHWKILLQSRAIENTCYIIAAAQCGTHHGSRKTYGHSSIIDPWGKVILEASTKPGIFSKNLDLELFAISIKAEDKQKLLS